MLDTQTIATIKATIPVLAATGPKLTAHFYQRMFSHNPELKDVFNMTHQFNHAQPEALFNAICAYAVNIENLAALLPAVERIAQKHASFNIQADQYQIVGHHLLATLDELLQPGQEVLDAWGKAYGVLADIFIQREEQIYQETEKSYGGWRGTRPFRIIKKQAESESICSFMLMPTDNQPLPNYKPGQYLAVYLQDKSLENQEIRQYSLTRATNGEYYRIAVKREPGGKVSNFLHDQAKEGDVISVAPPCGDFFLDISPDTPVALISGGVGQTPLLSMLHALNDQQHAASVYWLHATENSQIHAFNDEINQLKGSLSSLQSHVWYREKNEECSAQNSHEGLMDLTICPEIFADPRTHYYFCGPVAFMQHVAKQLQAANVPVEHMHYECFGPHKVM